MTVRSPLLPTRTVVATVGSCKAASETTTPASLIVLSKSIHSSMAGGVHAESEASVIGGV